MVLGSLDTILAWVGNIKRTREGRDLNSRSMARVGLELLKSAIIELLGEHPNGLPNVKVADLLDIHSERRGVQRDYLSWSVLSLLMTEGRIQQQGKNYLLPQG